MKHIMIFINSFLSVIAMGAIVSAGDFGVGTHLGYGTLQYEEHTSSVIPRRDAYSKQDVILFGVSGEYTFPGSGNLFTGITTDWAFGLGDTETWRKDGVQNQTNDISIFGQFYDLRFGYKDSKDKLYYRVYISGGWDGMHFRRKNFIEDGVPKPGLVTEDFSLWRLGAGAGAGYSFNEWAIDGRAAFSFYPEGTVENSNYPDVDFSTKGTCIDLGLGIARKIIDTISLYAGGSYTLLELDQSPVMFSAVRSENAVFPESETELVVGVINVTFAF